MQILRGGGGGMLVTPLPSINMNHDSSFSKGVFTHMIWHDTLEMN